LQNSLSLFFLFHFSDDFAAAMGMVVAPVVWCNEEEATGGQSGDFTQL